MKFLVIIMNYFVLHKILYSTDDSQKTLNDSKLKYSTAWEKNMVLICNWNPLSHHK